MGDEPVRSDREEIESDSECNQIAICIELESLSLRDEYVRSYMFYSPILTALC